KTGFLLKPAPRSGSCSLRSPGFRRLLQSQFLAKFLEANSALLAVRPARVFDETTELRIGGERLATCGSVEIFLGHAGVPPLLAVYRSGICADKIQARHQERTMIQGVHTMFYSSEPEALRAFLRDKLKLTA